MPVNRARHALEALGATRLLQAVRRTIVKAREVVTASGSTPYRGRPMALARYAVSSRWIGPHQREANTLRPGILSRLPTRLRRNRKADRLAGYRAPSAEAAGHPPATSRSACRAGRLGAVGAMELNETIQFAKLTTVPVERMEVGSVNLIEQPIPPIELRGFFV